MCRTALPPPGKKRVEPETGAEPCELCEYVLYQRQSPGEKQSSLRHAAQKGALGSAVKQKGAGTRDAEEKTSASVTEGVSAECRREACRYPGIFEHSGGFRRTGKHSGPEEKGEAGKPGQSSGQKVRSAAPGSLKEDGPK